MRTNLSLSIPKPCSEDWDHFTPSTTGRFCGSCSKVVVDFTQMGDDEIINFFTNMPSHACGRFRPDQLKSYSQITPPKINIGITLLKASLISLLFVLVSKQTSAQTILGKTKTEVIQYPDRDTEERASQNQGQIIKGIVKSVDDDAPLPAVNIVLKGSVEGTASDIDGRFEFPRKLKEGDVLVFNFIGFVTHEYVVPKKASDVIEITMTLSYEVMMGEVAVNDIYTTPQSGLHKFWSKVKRLF